MANIIKDLVVNTPFGELIRSEADRRRVEEANLKKAALDLTKIAGTANIQRIVQNQAREDVLAFESDPNTLASKREIELSKNETDLLRQKRKLEFQVSDEYKNLLKENLKTKESIALQVSNDPDMIKEKRTKAINDKFIELSVNADPTVRKLTIDNSKFAQDIANQNVISKAAIDRKIAIENVEDEDYTSAMLKGSMILKIPDLLSNMHASSAKFDYINSLSTKAESELLKLETIRNKPLDTTIVIKGTGLFGKDKKYKIESDGNNIIIKDGNDKEITIDQLEPEAQQQAFTKMKELELKINAIQDYENTKKAVGILNREKANALYNYEQDKNKINIYKTAIKSNNVYTDMLSGNSMTEAINKEKPKKVSESEGLFVTPLYQSALPPETDIVEETIIINEPENKSVNQDTAQDIVDYFSEKSFIDRAGEVLKEFVTPKPNGAGYTRTTAR